MSVVDYYEVLDLPRTATAAEIRRRCREVQQQCSPDRPDGGDPERVRLVHEAKAILLDPERRAAYDAELAGPQRPEDYFAEFLRAYERAAGESLERSVGKVLVGGLGRAFQRAVEATRKVTK